MWGLEISQQQKKEEKYYAFSAWGHVEVPTDRQTGNRNEKKTELCVSSIEYSIPSQSSTMFSV